MISVFMVYEKSYFKVASYITQKMKTTVTILTSFNSQDYVNLVL